ncbi:hypothetical protein TUM17580_19820 [Citrobacter farmeri]|nr:hypothetical protein TUM17580_19820 [Citrobacter farmeri]
MLGNERWTQTQAASEPVQEAEALVKRGTFYPVASIRTSANAESMIALDLQSRFDNILTGNSIIDTI